MSNQTQGTMVMVGALAATVGAVAFVALLLLGDFAFSPAAFMAILVAGVAAVILFLGFHRKPLEPAPAYTQAKAPAAPVSAPAPVAEPVVAVPVAAAAEPVAEAASDEAEIGSRPAALSAAREGGADDLKMIKGVGPKMETLCNTLGFYHFDQIANWTADEVAWVDNNLEGFKGRVTRDDWVAQATLLAAGGETEFSKKVEGGNVY